MFVAWLQADAQLSVQISMDQDVYLSGEAVVVKVELVNLSGQSVCLGEKPDWLEFTIESIDKPFVERPAVLDLSGMFALGSSMRATREINIQPYYDIIKTGRYKIIATVNVPEWGESYRSTHQIFDIIRGVEVVGYDVGVPPPLNEKGEPIATGKPPELRHYALVRVAYLDKMRLYARITDIEKTKVHRVVPICGMLSFSDPKAMLDGDSNLHIINQIHAKRFIYYVMNTSGDMLKREFYDYIMTKPTLFQNEDGSVSVKNGVRMWTSQDYPPSPRPVAPASIVTKPGDSVTNAPPNLKNMTKEEKKRYKEEKKRIKAEKKRLEKEEKKRQKAAKKD